MDGWNRNDFSGVREMSHRGSPVLSRHTAFYTHSPIPRKGLSGMEASTTPLFLFCTPSHTHATKVGRKETEGAGGGGNHSDDNQKSNYLIQKK